MRKNSKKGAIELGMNTIIIVVIGITLLSLALVWIRGMMGEKGIGGLTQSAFGQAQTAVSDIYKGTSEDLTVSPETLSINPGKSGRAKMIFSNLEDTDFSSVKFQTAVAEGEGASKIKVQCLFANTLKSTAGPYDVPSGKAKELDILVQVDKASSLGTSVCTITAPGTVDAEKSIIITVEK